MQSLMSDGEPNAVGVPYFLCLVGSHNRRLWLLVWSITSERRPGAPAPDADVLPAVTPKTENDLGPRVFHGNGCMNGQR